MGNSYQLLPGCGLFGNSKNFYSFLWKSIPEIQFNSILDALPSAGKAHHMYINTNERGKWNQNYLLSNFFIIIFIFPFFFIPNKTLYFPHVNSARWLCVRVCRVICMYIWENEKHFNAIKYSQRENNLTEYIFYFRANNWVPFFGIGGMCEYP